MKFLVTGAAGFIGSHVSQRLLDRGDEVVGIDNLNPYYSVQLKEDRLARLESQPNFTNHRLDIADLDSLDAVFKANKFDRVIHLAAQAGVRYSLENPHVYIQSNVSAFTNILECCRHHEVPHLAYASSSSVYGSNTKQPFSVTDNVDTPISLYAATKKANELMAHTYSHLFKLPTTGLRFFTVYGPWGRPDMAMFIFTKALFEGGTVKLFNYGNMRRDFTYVDDIVTGVVRVTDRIPTPETHRPTVKDAIQSPLYRIYNIGNHSPTEVKYLIEVLEGLTGKKANIEGLPMQMGDVPATFADVDDLMKDVDFKPATSIEEGASRFVSWYRDYFKV